MTPPIAAFFPGQGSQSVGMLDALADAFPSVTRTFEEASEALGRDLWALVHGGPEEALAQTENTQPAMLTAGVAVWRLWQESGGAPAVLMAGHSLGEYSALVASGALSLGDGVRLAADRGRFMQEAVPAGDGAMAAILGLEDAEVSALCADQAEGEVLAAVNFNAPGQVVIAGTSAAVARAVAAAKAAGAKRALLLSVSVPSHCALMRPAAERLEARLRDLNISLPGIPVLHNVDAAVAPDLEGLRQRLVSQLHQPVLWVDTVRAVADAGVTIGIECGPGKVLAGLNKRIDKRLTTLAVWDPQSLAAALEGVSHVDG